MEQDNQQGNEEKRGGQDEQPGGQGAQPARESSAFGKAGREVHDPESIDKQDSWRPTDDPVGARHDGENEGTGTIRDDSTE